MPPSALPAAPLSRHPASAPQDHGQFSEDRYAFLFKPGSYAADIPVGFYTTIVGLGSAPTDVKFTGEKGVYCEEGGYNFTVGALDNFWRSAENFHSQATYSTTGAVGMLWAVSQATPLRRLVVDNELILYEYEPPYLLAGRSSGGFMSNALVGNSTLLAAEAGAPVSCPSKPKQTIQREANVPCRAIVKCLSVCQYNTIQVLLT